MNTLKEYNKNGIYLKHAVTDSPHDDEFGMHIHGTFEIYFFISGRVDYLVEGTAYPLHKGDMLFIRPFESHKPKIYEGAVYERYNINFPISLLESIDPEHRLLIPFFDRPLGYGNLYTQSELGGLSLESIFHEMCYFDGDSYSKQLKILTSLLQILGAAGDVFSKRAAEDAFEMGRAGKIVAYINSHISEIDSVPQLAKHFYLSHSQLNRIFKDATGASPWSYITAKRLTLANELIESGMTAKAAAEDCGFRDYSVFYRAFIKHFGHAPTERTV